jgi:hypothetical protein
VLLVDYSVPRSGRPRNRPRLRAVIRGPSVAAVMAAIVGFTHLLSGLDNPTLVREVSNLLDQPSTSRKPPRTYAGSNAKADRPAPRRPPLPADTLGRRVAVLFTKSYSRGLAPCLAVLDPHLPEELTMRSGRAAVTPIR